MYFTLSAYVRCFFFTRQKMFIKRKNTSRKKYAVDVVCSELQELVTKPNSAKRMLNNNKESFISVIAKSLKTQNYLIFH